MSWNYHSDDYDERDEMRRRVDKKLRQRGADLTVFPPPEGTKMTRTFWGQAWCRHLENYADYAYRLPRGRSYLRGGRVYDLKLAEGGITSLVAGSDLYSVEIKVLRLLPERWEKLKERCQGQVAGLVELLEGRLGPGVMKAVTDTEAGLFPSPKEIKLSCSCPDYADLCKHCGATLYAVGVLFDREPDLFFKLRGVNPAELIATTAEAITRPSSADVLEDDQLADIFGIDLGEGGDLEAAPPPTNTGKRTATKTAAKRAPRKKPL